MDYNEIIETMRSTDVKVVFCRSLDAADAIETLLAERDAAVEDLHRMHTICMDIGGSCPECGDQIDELLDAACGFCRNGGFGCWADSPEEESRCAAFEWRGPQKGDTNGT